MVWETYIKTKRIVTSTDATQWYCLDHLICQNLIIIKFKLKNIEVDRSNPNVASMILLGIYTTIERNSLFLDWIEKRNNWLPGQTMFQATDKATWIYLITNKLVYLVTWSISLTQLYIFICWEKSPVRTRVVNRSILKVHNIMNGRFRFVVSHGVVVLAQHAADDLSPPPIQLSHRPQMVRRPPVSPALLIPEIKYRRPINLWRGE